MLINYVNNIVMRASESKILENGYIIMIKDLWKRMVA